ncbi:hypothetical protein ROHU_026902 [Labeo rohita]|uniref:Uncharacterized protein n=1 Tax=Labeo rohita TaxID=84645 RepID=A0A498MDD1_LABRO|nr:hypothetical protein ROHU_026902 [Labeo rohita]
MARRRPSALDRGIAAGTLQDPLKRFETRADAGEEEGGMENDYWISVIRDESFIGGQRSISCAGAADKAAIY